MEKIIDKVDSVFCGEMGIKKIIKGEDLIYERTSSYIYLELTSEGE